MPTGTENSALLKFVTHKSQYIINWLFSCAIGSEVVSLAAIKNQNIVKFRHPFVLKMIFGIYSLLVLLGFQKF